MRINHSEQAALAQIERDHLDRQAYFAPSRTDLPPAMAEAMKGFTDYVRQSLGILECEVKFFAPGPRDSRVGFVLKDIPNEAWVAAVHADGRARKGHEIANTIAHECMHSAGYQTEAAAKFGAERLVAAYFGDDRENEAMPHEGRDVTTKLWLKGESM